MIRLPFFKCCIQTVLFALFILKTESFGESLPKNKDVELKNQESHLIPPRIVGGDFVARGKYPSVVAFAVVLYNSPNPPQYKTVCAGTLLPSQRHVLTSALCVFKVTEVIRSGVPFAAFMGYNDFSSFWYMARVYANPDFDPNTNEHDIGIIVLQNEVPNTIATAVTLESASTLSQSYANQQAVVVGWGATQQALDPGSPIDGSSSYKKEANVTIMDNTDCGIRYHSDMPKSLLLYTKPQQFLCATSFANEGPCEYDEGGPLFLGDVQVGIVSKRQGCADPRYPAVYTRVAAYQNFINEWLNKPLL